MCACVRCGDCGRGGRVPLKRARVSLTLRLICGYLLRSLLPFLTCIYETLLDLEIYKIYKRRQSTAIASVLVIVAQCRSTMLWLRRSKLHMHEENLILHLGPLPYSFTLCMKCVSLERDLMHLMHNAYVCTSSGRKPGGRHHHCSNLPGLRVGWDGETHADGICFPNFESIIIAGDYNYSGGLGCSVLSDGRARTCGTL